MITENTIGNLTPELRTSIRRSHRARTLRDLALALPLLIFLILVFAWPILAFSYRAIDNTVLHRSFGNTYAALQGWAPPAEVPIEAYEALASDIRSISSPEEVAVAARNLNNFLEGFRGLVMKTSNRLPKDDAVDWRQVFQDIDKRWQESKFWVVLKHETGALTPSFALASLDLKLSDDGWITQVPPERRLYVPLLFRTFEISFWVALICLLLGYPTAFVLTRLTPVFAGIGMICVLLPFWTSLLVRTTAWIILLQGNGPVNSFLQYIGAITDPLQLIFNRFGTLVAMSHVLLPYMILPLYSVMKMIPENQMLAAQSLGANIRIAFLRVYLPQTASGIAAGLLLVFILALGYYITPALVGGPGDQMISYMITYHVNEVVNWGMASALGVLLLLSTCILLAMMSRFIKVRQIMG